MLASLRVPVVGRNRPPDHRGGQPIPGKPGQRYARKQPARLHRCVAFIETPNGHQQRVLMPRLDYHDANSRGTRGVEAYYILESGTLYEVTAPLGWSRWDQYWCTVAPDGGILRFDTLQEAQAWLTQHQPPLTSDRLASMS